MAAVSSPPRSGLGSLWFPFAAVLPLALPLPSDLSSRTPLLRGLWRSRKANGSHNQSWVSNSPNTTSLTSWNITPGTCLPGLGAIVISFVESSRYQPWNALQFVRMIFQSSSSSSDGWLIASL